MREIKFGRIAKKLKLKIGDKVPVLHCGHWYTVSKVDESHWVFYLSGSDTHYDVIAY